MEGLLSAAQNAVARCRALAECTEAPGFTTRSFLSPPMHDVHAQLGGWMTTAGMEVSVDPAGNLRGCYRAAKPSARRLFIGSHLDTVRHAGPYDGVLGVIMGVGLIEMLRQRRLKFDIEVIGFSEEEGLRFGTPFIGSRALVGAVDDELMELRDSNGIRVRDAIKAFGLDPSRIAEARAGDAALGYVEFHIEQGPILESLDLPLGVVETIVGQSRLVVTFRGKANHAGTTPMHLRYDALTGAAEWVTVVEREARDVPGLVATVGSLVVEPGAANVIAGIVRASLDVRHAEDAVRRKTVEALLERAKTIAARRALVATWEQSLDQPAVAMDPSLTRIMESAVIDSGYDAHRMMSGAGHDAMVIANHIPSAMLFLRTPRGISHHASESVMVDDVAAALSVGLRFVKELDAMEDVGGAYG